MQIKSLIQTLIPSLVPSLLESKNLYSSDVILESDDNDWLLTADDDLVVMGGPKALSATRQPALLLTTDNTTLYTTDNDTLTV